MNFGGKIRRELKNERSTKDFTQSGRQEKNSAISLYSNSVRAERSLIDILFLNCV